MKPPNFVGPQLAHRKIMRRSQRHKKCFLVDGKAVSKYAAGSKRMLRAIGKRRDDHFRACIRLTLNDEDLGFTFIQECTSYYNDMKRKRRSHGT